MDDKRKEIIKRAVAMLAIIIIIGAVMSIIVRYEVKGEDNMPFELSKIVIISTAEGEQKTENTENAKWNMVINQNNDIYFDIVKNENSKKTYLIKYVRIENINIKNTPKKGNVRAFMPNSKEGRKFVYEDIFEIKESLTFNGDINTDEKKLTIGNQGGTIAIRIANCNLGEYISNEDAEIVHNGTLIKTTNTTLEEIKFNVSFDFIINIDGIEYKANIELDLPYDDIIEKGITNLEINKDDIVFKRT